MNSVLWLVIEQGFEDIMGPRMCVQMILWLESFIELMNDVGRKQIE